MNPDGVSEAVRDCEKVCAAVCLMLTRDDLLSTGLEPGDFHLLTCGEIWGEALKMSDPCPALLMDRRPDLLPEYQQLYGRFGLFYSTPPLLMAHADIVKRDSERRQRLRELGKEAQRVHRGEVAFYERPENQREMDV